MRIILYDIEIENCIPDRNEPRKPELRYCNGWDDHAGMGIAVLAAYDYFQDKFRVFLKDNLRDFQELLNASDLLVGYNNINFDDKLLAAHSISRSRCRSYDIFKEAKRGLNVSEQEARMMRGFKLHDLHLANFGTGKTETGEHAPVLWQQKQFGRVIDYCLNDVLMTKNLMDRIIEQGELFHSSGRKLKLRSPQEVYKS